MTYKKFFRKEISHLQKSSFLKGKENWKISLAHNVLCNFICVCIKLKKACFCKLYTGIYWAKNLYSLLMHYTEEKQRQWQRRKHWCLCRTHKHDINSLFSFVGLYDAVFFLKHCHQTIFHSLMFDIFLRNLNQWKRYVNIYIYPHKSICVSVTN